MSQSFLSTFALLLLSTPIASSLPNQSFTFDAPFGSNMVLQRAPSQAAVYGYLDYAASGVKVSVTDATTGRVVCEVDADLNVTQQPFGPDWGVRPCPKAACPPYDMNTFTPVRWGKNTFTPERLRRRHTTSPCKLQWSTTIPTWKALLPAMPAGGNFTITATCTGCTYSSGALILEGVTFGDVWYCSGQSNMWLPVLNTFSRNLSAANISNGGLSNVRLMAGSSGSVPYATWPPAYGSGPKASNPWMTAAQAVPPGCVEKQNCPLFEIGGTCWYFAEALAEGGLSVPIGILDTAIGGQRIEEFMTNSSQLKCSNRSSENIPWWDSQLYGQQVLPFVDMTIKGWVWYQGENNMGGVYGSSTSGIGYGCEQLELVNGWRSVWSAVPNTTDPLAPFGIVTLASSGAEGADSGMGAMRWAQSLNYGVLPSPNLPNSFIAQAYDLDDPWGPEGGPCFGLPPAGWQCCPTHKVPYNATVCAGREEHCSAACAADAGTTFAMGAIHPRDKRPVGQRLGRAALNTVYGGNESFTGPTLAGCSVTGGGVNLTISFDATLLRGDSLVLTPPAPYIPGKYPTGGSLLWVQTNASLFCIEPFCIINASTGGCVSNERGKPVYQTCPTWAGGDGVTQLTAGLYDSGWTQLNFSLASSNSIVVDLSPLNGTAPTAVKYAWGVIDCCDHSDPDVYVTKPCGMTCPIGSSSGLPANPFQARISDQGTCECIAPQTCGQA